MLLAFFSVPVLGIKASYFFILILYGMATMISGGILQFKPLVIGSILAFAVAAVSLFFGGVEQLLFICVSLLVSYIVPVHMLRSKYKSQNA
jgi:hypothetical protein